MCAALTSVPAASSDARVRRLLINEIFLSLQGETSRVGLPTAFIRLTGCPLRCTYCDTAYAFHEGKEMSVDEVTQSIASYATRYVTVTGGEPLAQKPCLTLLAVLCDAGYDVSLETGGALDISPVDPRVARIVDVKTPDSGESGRNRSENLDVLGSRDQVKFVICSRADYEWSRELVRERRLHESCEVLFSPSHAQLPAPDLADWILADCLPVRLQIQLHKYLWGGERGR